jgi:hypothetical protein
MKTWLAVFVVVLLGVLGVVGFFWLATVINKAWGDFACFAYVAAGFSAAIATCVVEIRRRVDH